MKTRDDTFWIVLRETHRHGSLEFVERCYGRESAERAAESAAEKAPGVRFFAAKVKIEAVMPTTPEVTLRTLDTPIPF